MSDTTENGKKAYHTPELSLIGDFRTLTRGTGTRGARDNPGGTQKTRA